MKPKTLILMIVAVVCGLAASYLTSRVLADRAQAPAQEEEKVKILVARVKINTGTLFKEPEKFFVEKSFTKGEEPKKAITAMEQIKDRRLNKPLSEEQFVTPDDLLDPKQFALDSMLPHGMRAVAVKVTTDAIVGGFVLPSSHVDILLTTHQGDQSVSRIILQNMLVLAADTTMTRDPEKQSMVAGTITLAAKPEDATRLRLAESCGQLSFTLRGSEDEEITRTRDSKTQDLSRSSADNGSSTPGGEETAGLPAGANIPDVPAPAVNPPTVKEPDPPKPPKTITQIIFNGDTVTKTVYVSREDGDVTTQVEKTGMEALPKPEKKPVVSREPVASPDKPSPSRAVPDKGSGDPKKGMEPGFNNGRSGSVG